ncbi:cell envelope integrity protein CreD [Chishuiella sp.]|uniref:cell envelope integrity protein CreD n=1 Tax=Chishuiella sp. TaxID=1969467 RepID=UPI0028AE3CA5|nr:cell envelope integrity protein CreD [Chishuiella sp.]
MENNNSNQETKIPINQNKTMIKGFIVGILTLCLLIPIPFILSLIQERQKYKEDVTSEISNKWSGKQTIYGPFLEITYSENSKNAEGKDITIQKKIYTSADKLDIKGDINTQFKKRSIYETSVYKSKIDLEIKFKNFNDILENIKIKPENIISTKLIFGITDSKGYENNVIAKSANKNYELISDNQTLIINNEIKNQKERIQFLSQNIDYSTFDFNKVTINLSIKGSEILNFIPSAINTNVDLTTNWKDLKYDGNFLPNDNPTNKNGKTNIKWSIYQQNPLNGQLWRTANNFSDYTFGVEFLQMNDHYDKTYRSTKYAILFISLTFAAFFFIEVKNNFNIHIIQYALVGFAICINFILLLSLSEYIGFDFSYLISSIATIILISLFIYSFLNSLRLTLKITLMLIILYSFIYSILQLKEHALLVGSIGLFFILAIIMYYSKNIEWNKIK